MMNTIENQSNITPSVEEMQKEIRSLKRKLALSEGNLTRARLISAAQERTETILNASIKKELQFFKLVLENATNILLLFDFDGRFAYASKTFLTITSIANFGFINGRHFKEVLKPLISEENLNRFSEAVESAAVQKSTVALEEQIDFGFRGLASTFSIFITPMTDEDGKHTGIMSLFNDITEINNALEAAKSANLAKSNFLANMSHEIRTPLNAIIGMSAIGKNSNDIDKINYSLERINDSSKYLLGIINDILDMSKIENNHFELSFSEFIFEKMFLKTIDVMRFKIDEKNIAFSLYCDPLIPETVFSDEQRLSQVIINLLSNAVKFTPENGCVSVRAEVESFENDNYTLRVSVKDSGIGITEEQKPHLFKPFSQADGSISRKYGGTGLGLVISKNIVNMMDGDIWFDSVEGKGTTFFFTMKTRSCHMNTTLETFDNKTKEYDDFTGKTILLVDDIEINREIIVALLEPMGINIVCAENGREAVEKFIACPKVYDLIFMDVHMPEMDGYDATRRIRDLGVSEAKCVPIVAMTANVFKEDVERCLASGMDDHTGKPINIEEILEKIRKWNKKCL